MNIQAFIADWIAVSNRYDTASYLSKYHHNAVLEDPSVGRDFKGHAGISEYFTSYFIGYQTQTTLLALQTGNNKAHLEVEFTGGFPGGKIGGVFDFVFRDGKITKVKADLVH